MFYGGSDPFPPEWSATSHPIHRVESVTERPHILPSRARKFAPKLGHSSKIGALLIFILPIVWHRGSKGDYLIIRNLSFGVPQRQNEAQS